MHECSQVCSGRMPPHNFLTILCSFYYYYLTVKHRSRHNKTACMQGDLDIGLLEIASASKMYPLAILQYFPTLISNPEATLATMARKHMSAATRELLGFGLPPGTPRPVTFHPLPQSQPGGPPQGALSMVASTAEYSTEYGTPQATPGTPRTVCLFVFLLSCSRCLLSCFC